MNLENLKKLIRTRLKSIGKSNREVFDEIYQNHGWGTNEDGESSSGRGSLAVNSAEYERFVVEFVQREGIRSILDVGCGDFQVSKRILNRLSPEIEYLGIDVSEVAVERNRSNYENERIRFRQLDVVEDDVPEADLILVREVLQHLPNKSIKRVLPKLKQRAHRSRIVLTNTVARSPETVNLDIPAGGLSRAGMGSGLWLDRPPFDCEVEELLRVAHRDHPTEIITVELLSGRS